MRIKLFFLFAAMMLALNLPPATSLAADNTHDPVHMSGSAGHNHNMDMTVHSVDETTNPEMPNMPGHNMDMPVDPRQNADTPVVSVEEPVHGGHESSSSGTNSEKTEVNRAGLLGGFGLFNGLVILSAVILRRKTVPLKGGSRNGR